MMDWLPCELHTHTVHSDGAMTLTELAKSAKKLEIGCIALTDHNTISGYAEIPAVTRETGVMIARGLEWTTFYGHTVLMGVREYLDWKDITPKNIDEALDAVHVAGGLTGMVHPFRMGSPISTGCHWEFEVNDFSKLDYIEVWSGTFPPVRPMNHKAFELWDRLLNQGYRITGVSGRDWHANSPDEVPLAVTYLGIDPADFTDIDRAVSGALRGGRAVSTLGPLLGMTVDTGEGLCGIGDTAALRTRTKTIQVDVSADFSTRRNQWNLDMSGCSLVLESNIGPVARAAIGNEPVSLTLPAGNLSWLRAQLYGRVQGEDCLVAFTNPVYFRNP